MCIIVASVVVPTLIVSRDYLAYQLLDYGTTYIRRHELCTSTIRGHVHNGTGSYPYISLQSTTS